MLDEQYLAIKKEYIRAYCALGRLAKEEFDEFLAADSALDDAIKERYSVSS